MPLKYLSRAVILTAMLAGMCMVGFGCRKVDLRRVAIQVPGMKSEACAGIVTQALAREQQIPEANIHVDLEHRMIEVRYDSLKQSLKNLEYTIANSGFQANEIPANESVRLTLPEGCR